MLRSFLYTLGVFSLSFFASILLTYQGGLGWNTHINSIVAHAFGIFFGSGVWTLVASWFVPKGKYAEYIKEIFYIWFLAVAVNAVVIFMDIT